MSAVRVVPLVLCTMACFSCSGIIDASDEQLQQPPCDRDKGSCSADEQLEQEGLEPPPPAVCPVPAAESAPDPEIHVCNHMDWQRSRDGFYFVSRFGTDGDGTTQGRTTTCGYLQRHYDANGCLYDNQSDECVAGDGTVPWVQGHVDYDRAQMLAMVEEHLEQDVPAPEYFYVAGAQRFGCGALLRVSDLQTGRCVVVYAEDGGPGAAYEKPDKGGRRILDASPAVVSYLQLKRWGWASSTLLYVEWGKSDDVPGMRCTPCSSTPADNASPLPGPYNVNHMMPTGHSCE